MDDKLRASLERFVNAFEAVFDKDWIYTKQMLGITEETKEQAESVKDADLETIFMLAPNGTFLNPEVESETEDWGHRGELLSAYRKLKEML
jgi:hypothetical protein